MPRLRLFVYGTLQPGAPTRMGHWVERRLLSSEAASVAGRILALRAGGGWFPALVQAKSCKRVRGTLCEFALRPGELALLDRYEGIEYRRMSVPVRPDNGAAATAQCYLWRAALPPGARAIRSGDFLGWLRDNRLSAYTSPRDGR